MLDLFWGTLVGWDKFYCKKMPIKWLLGRVFGGQALIVNLLHRLLISFLGVDMPNSCGGVYGMCCKEGCQLCMICNSVQLLNIESTLCICIQLSIVPFYLDEGISSIVMLGACVVGLLRSTMRIVIALSCCLYVCYSVGSHE